jgi:hypothetical protein
VAELLRASEVRVPAYYHMVAVGEQPAGFGVDPPVPGNDRIEFGDSSLLIGVADDVVDPALRLEHWDGEPPPVEPGYAVQGSGTLAFPTGRIDLVQITRGPIAYDLDLPPGRYDVRVTGWRTGVPERYLVQCWLRTPSAARLHYAGCRIVADEVVVVEYRAPEPLLRIACDVPGGLFRMELWDGTPPEWTALPVALAGPFHTEVRIGRFRMHPLRAGGMDRTEFLPIGAAWVPPGGYRVQLTGSADRFLAQLWPG